MTLRGEFGSQLFLVDVKLTAHDVDRNAGGRTSDLTSEMVKTCQSLIGIETCMHLTCTNMPAEKVDIALKVCKRTYITPVI